MTDGIWKLGPPGQLRDLFCPEEDVDISVQRFGGIHQNLSGARTMDITGVRQSIKMEWEWLSDADYAWLQALNLRLLPGPYRMISPLSKNRLTPEASLCKVGAGTRRGWVPDRGIGVRTFDYPAAITDQTQLSQSTTWKNRQANWAGRWDQRNLVTVFAGESVTFSLYVKAAAAIATVHLGLDWYDRTKTVTGSATDVVRSATTGWTRWTMTATVPAGATMARPYIYTADVTNDIQLAAAQFEAGSSATAWQIGGGAPVVLLDQLSDVSPMFGYDNLSATFLEA